MVNGKFCWKISKMNKLKQTSISYLSKRHSPRQCHINYFQETPNMYCYEYDSEKRIPGTSQSEIVFSRMRIYLYLDIYVRIYTA